MIHKGLVALNAMSGTSDLRCRPKVYDQFMNPKMSDLCTRCEEAVLADVVGEMEYHNQREPLPERYRLVRCTREG